MGDIEIINGIPVDWSKFKSNAKGKNLENAKQGYIKLCELVHKNGHKLVSEYTGAKNHILISFGCIHEYSSTNPDKYKQGRGCPLCSGKSSVQAKNDFFEMLNNNGHKLLSEYVDVKTKVLIDFYCGHEPHWLDPHNYKHGKGCPRCVGKYGQAKEDFIKTLKNKGHLLLSEYKNRHTKVLIDFKCGHEPHKITPGNYISGKGCPMCINKGESALHQLLLDMGYEVYKQKKYKDLKYKRILPYDFYLPKFNLLIELDGEHHREEVYYKTNISEKDIAYAKKRLEETQYRDKLKNDYAKFNNIPLLRIEYRKSKIELDKWKQLILDKINEVESEVD